MKSGKTIGCVINTNQLVKHVCKRRHKYKKLKFRKCKEVKLNLIHESSDGNVNKLVR